MRCRRALALLLAAGMLCSGCSTGAISSNYRPVEDLALIQTIGVDRAPEGVCLSAATGKACENEAPKRMTQSGVSMLAALDQLQDRTPSAELFYAQTSYLLLGEEAAAAGGLAPLLDFIARDPDMRLSTPLFIVRGGTAQQAVMETGDDKTDVTEALAALEKDIALDGTSHACSCTDIARALAGSGCAVVGAVTCVRTPEDEGGKLALAPAGYAIFRDGDYVGSIEPETARGASMLLGVAGHGDLAVTDSDGSTVMLTLGTCKTRFRPVWSSDGALARVELHLVDSAESGAAELAGLREVVLPDVRDGDVVERGVGGLEDVGRHEAGHDGGGHGAREDRGDAVLGDVELALDIECGDVHPRVDDAADEARDLVAVEVELLRGERRAQERPDHIADVGLVELGPRLKGGIEP